MRARFPPIFAFSKTRPLRFKRGGDEVASAVPEISEDTPAADPLSLPEDAHRGDETGRRTACSTCWAMETRGVSRNTRGPQTQI
jgi:hypothetical protein